MADIRDKLTKHQLLWITRGKENGPGKDYSGAHMDGGQGLRAGRGAVGR